MVSCGGYDAMPMMLNMQIWYFADGPGFCFAKLWTSATPGKTAGFYPFAQDSSEISADNTLQYRFSPKIWRLTGFAQFLRCERFGWDGAHIHFLLKHPWLWWQVENDDDYDIYNDDDRDDGDDRDDDDAEGDDDCADWVEIWCRIAATQDYI